MSTRGGGLPRNVPFDILIDYVNRLATRNVGRDITLTASATTTTLTDERIGPNSFVWFMPQSANASTALASLYVTGRIKGSATINHPSSSNVCTFTYIVLG